MAVEMKLEYRGELSTQLEHGPSGDRIGTDAPADNGGRGAAFSPTDLLGAALLSCAVTTMAIKGPKEGIAFTSARGAVKKHMTQEGPRRIQKLEVEIELPAALDLVQRTRLEAIARHCPVALSLAPTVELALQFRYV